MKLQTDIISLDKLLGGGIEKESLVVLWTDPGVDCSPFIYQMVNKALKDGLSVVFFTQTKRADLVVEDIRRKGWDIDKDVESGKLVFVDGFSKLMSAPSKQKYIVQEPKDADSIIREIGKALDESDGKGKLIIFDAISSAIDICGEGCLTGLKLKELSEKHKAVSVGIFVEWPYDEVTLSAVRGMADAIIQLKAIEEKVILREFFTVPKVRWHTPAKKGVPYKVLPTGGINVYVPKVLVLGPYNAGKSSFIHSVSDRAVSVDRLGTTIALDHGHVEHAGFSIDLFGTPGQERFDPLLEMLGGEALGVIVVLDSTAPESFERAKEMLAKSKTTGLPSVIVANKADLPGAKKPEEIREIMTLPKDTSILPVVAEDLEKVKSGVKEPCRLRKDDVHKVLDALLGKFGD